MSIALIPPALVSSSARYQRASWNQASPPASDTIRAGIYVRISSDDDSKIKGLGVDRQEKDCRALVNANGWELHDVYCDNDTSASKPDVERLHFLRLMADVENGIVNRIVVLSQDRLVRLPEEVESVMRTMRKRRIGELDTVTDGRVNIESLSGRLMARIKGNFDIYYAEYISQKVQQKKDELAERGLPAGHARAFGYEPDGMTIREAEATLIREAAARFMDGESLNAICRDWDVRDVRTVRGARWTPNVLRNIMCSPRVAGLRQHRGQIVGDAQWPAILDRGAWQEVAMAFEGRRGTRTSPNRKLLTGLAYCGICDASLYGGRNNGKLSYVCRKGPGFSGCGRLMVVLGPWSANKATETPGVESLVIERMLNLFDRSRPGVPSASSDPTVDDIARLQGQLTELAEMWAEGEMTRQEWNKAGQVLRAKLATAQAQARQIASASILGPYMATPGLLRTVWESLPIEMKRRILGAVIERITVAPVPVRGRHTFDPSRITVDWRI